jgi:hypothetical protein
MRCIFWNLALANVTEASLLFYHQRKVILESVSDKKERMKFWQ